MAGRAEPLRRRRARKGVEWEFPLFYPLPAVLFAVPFTFLPLWIAEAAVVALGFGLFAWAVTRDTWRSPVLLGCLSLAAVQVLQTAQWSPLLTAAALLPSLGFLLAAKPTLALALLVAYPSRRALVGAAACGLLTLLIWSWWVDGWLAALPAATHISAPITRWGGPLLLLALLKWRRPEARLLTALACVPHTPELYEVVPLFLIITCLEEGLILVMLIWLAQMIRQALMPPDGDYLVWMTLSGQVIVALIYLPCLITVLRRPNEGSEWGGDADRLVGLSTDEAVRPSGEAPLSGEAVPVSTGVARALTRQRSEQSAFQ
jgi:hypothetical protein